VPRSKAVSPLRSATALRINDIRYAWVADDARLLSSNFFTRGGIPQQLRLAIAQHL